MFFVLSKVNQIVNLTFSSQVISDKHSTKILFLLSVLIINNVSHIEELYKVNSEEVFV